ncbi:MULTISPECIES: class I SAM-dependent methyltransferase [Niastella]|uniref:Class I SAM-dependent methyltransferase n=1 Tax=Niastella soli TaxID=2821487 RepID=A0ABS3Z5F8_9BACT|nr:class I SAM-dependent methyltransferase [Niastella soli]MBO9204641.1 class I SAM-dependent methyltransferase [Niastella soli]
MKAVSKTAYYCGGVRMQDAESAKPLIGDHYAKRLLGKEGIAYWEEFKQFTRPNAGNTARHYLIDSLIKKELAAHPDATIILIGAGLDSRAYRLDGGKWIEIDEEAIIAHKNNTLPINECKNPLERIPIDFEKEKLADKLQPYSGRPHVVFIVEGVLMYLTDEQRNAMLTVLTTLFPSHVLFCDLMNKGFFEKFSGEIYQKLLENGAIFKDISDEPDRIFIAKGYKKRSVTGMPQAIHDLGLIRLPWFVRKFVFGKLINGYAVYHFTYGL